MKPVIGRQLAVNALNVAAALMWSIQYLRSAIDWHRASAQWIGKYKIPIDSTI